MDPDECRSRCGFVQPKNREDSVMSHWRCLITIFLNKITSTESVGRCVNDGEISLPSSNRYTKMFVFRRTGKKKKK